MKNRSGRGDFCAILRIMTRRIKLGLALAIVVQTIVYLLAGVSKSYIHMDEAYSLALAQYDKIDITENADFYNTWHTDAYYQDYLAVQEKDQGNWRPYYHGAGARAVFQMAGNNFEYYNYGGVYGILVFDFM